MESTTRRGLLGAIAVAPIAAASRASAALPSIDVSWSMLVTDLREKRAAWLLTTDLEDQALDQFHAAETGLSPEPTKPTPSSIDNLTIAQIRAASSSPENVAAWAAYEREHAAWKAEVDQVRDTFTGPAKAEYERAYGLYANAFNALTTYRVTNLRDLSEKIEIIAKDYDRDDVPQEYLADVLADVRYLSGEA